MNWSTSGKRIGLALAVAMGLFCFSPGASAQMDPKAWDNASQSAYSGGNWANGSNGGSGFGAWAISYIGGDWRGSYTGNPADKGLSGMPNPSWGMYAHTGTGNGVTATRTFTALDVGDELSFKWAFNWDSGSTPGKGIKIFAGATQVIDINNAGSSDITVNGVNTGFGYGVNAMTWTIKRVNTTQLSITANDRDGSGTYTVTITAGAPTSIQFYMNRQSDSQGNREPFWNDLKIQPTIKYDQTITFAEGAWQTKTYGNSSFALTASASSGLTVSFASSDPTVATVSGNTVTILKAGTTTITASQAGNNNYNAATPVARVLTVNKANPTVSAWPSATPITLGQTLASSTLVGGSSTPTGSFAWTTPSYEPTEAGTASYSVTFTPNETDIVNYNTAQNNVSLTVNAAPKVDPDVYTWPTASAITYGQTLASSSLSGGSADVDGHFAWSDDTIVPVVGGPAQSVTFYPDDDEAYNTAISTVAITVNKADPVVTTWPTASAITYGQTLASSSFSGGSATPVGLFAFTTPTTAPDVGTAAQSVTYTPTDTANYNTAQSTVNVTVNKATPTITTQPTASIIFVGDSLADSTLSDDGAASVDGTFYWTDDTVIPAHGTSDQSVTFTPTDGTRYNPVMFDVSVSVWTDAITFYAKTPSWADHDPNDPQIWGPFTSEAWTGHTMVFDSESGWWSVRVEVNDSTAQITYQWRFCEATATKYQKAPGGASDPTFTTATGEIWIDGSDDGSYTWYNANDFSLAPASITDGGAPPEPTPVLFYARVPVWADHDPDNPSIWGPFTSSTWTEHTMTYDEVLGWWKVEVDVLDAEAAITYQLRFCEATVTKYQKATGDLNADPSFTTTTGEIWIDASKNDLVWAEGGGDLFYLPCGRVTETEPDFDTVTFYVRVPAWADGDPDDPQIWGPFLGEDCWSTHPMTYDSDLGWWKVEVEVLDSSVELTYLLRFCELGVGKWQKATGDETFSVDPTFTTTTGEIWIDGSDDANFVWSEGDDYSLVAGAITENQPKDDQTITFAEGAWQSRTYGDSAFDLVASASSGLDVSFESLNTSVATISGITVTIVGAGEATIRATQPGNSAYHAAEPVDRVLTVTKAASTIDVTGDDSYTYNGSAQGPDSADVTGSTGEVTYEYAGTGSTTYGPSATKPSAVGTYQVVATVVADANYEGAQSDPFGFTITGGTATIITPPSASAIVYGQTLADSDLTDGEASVAGTFDWTDDSIAPDAGTADYSVTFTPTDPGYSPVIFDVSLEVAKADQTITFPAITDKLTTDVVGLSATASSGLEVSFAVDSGPAQLDGTTLTFTGEGTVSIVASQSGDANYNAASDVTRTFDVTEPELAVVVSQTAVNVREGGEGRFYVRLNKDPGEWVTVNVSRSAGDDSIVVRHGTSRTFNSSTWDTWQVVILGQDEDENAVSEEATFQISAEGLDDRFVTATTLDDDIGENLALGASGSTISGFRASRPWLLIDGVHTDSLNYGHTWWTNVPPGTMTLDLKNTATVSRVRLLNFHWTHRVHRYTIESSTDGLSWSMLADASGEDRQGWDDWPVADVAVRYLKFTGLSNSANQSVAIAELEVYGTRPEIEVALPVFSKTSVNVREGGRGTFFMRLDREPRSSVVFTVTRILGDESIVITAGATRIFDPSNWDVWQPVVLGQAKDDNDVGEEAVFRISAAGRPDYFMPAIALDEDIGENLALASSGATITGVKASRPWMLIDGIHTASGNYGHTMWTATPPGTMTLDLGGDKVVSRVRILNWDWTYRVHRYTIESSTDGVNWTMLADASEEDRQGWDDWEVDNQTIRYLKFTGLYNSENQSVVIPELEVYAAPPAPEGQGMALSMSPESVPVSVLTSDGPDDETGWLAVDGDPETAWVGQQTGGGYLVVEYAPALTLKALAVDVTAESLADAQVFTSLDAEEWQSLPEDLEKNPVSLNFLWVVFPDDGTDAVPQVLEIWPNP